MQPILQSFSLNEPEVEHIKGISLADGTNVNLTHAGDDSRLPAFWIEKIKEIIVLRNKHLFLGKTMTPHSPGKLPSNCVCFKLNPNTALPNNIVLTFISSQLDFIYSTKVSINDFWNNASIGSYPFSSTTVTNISFLATDTDINKDPVLVPANIIARLREDNHLVFIHPDSFVP